MMRVRRLDRSQRRGCWSRGRRARRRGLWVAALCASLALGTACAVRQQRSGYGRTLYAWTDVSGNVRYTTYPERVPVVRLHTLQEVVPGRSAAANAALLPGARTAVAASGAPAPTGDTAARLAALDARIAELEASIRHDEEILKLLISDPEAAPKLHSSEELAAIAEHLPERQATLRELREERSRLGAGDAP